MSLLSVLVREPGMDCQKEWLLPNILRGSYVAGCVLIIVGAAYAFFMIVFEVVMTRGLSGGDVFARLLGAILGIPLISLILIVWNRLWYEIGILLFRMFESERDMIQELVSQRSSMNEANQYICDRLAEISGNTSREG